jgi:hypothetical protein
MMLAFFPSMKDIPQAGQPSRYGVVCPLMAIGGPHGPERVSLKANIY